MAYTVILRGSIGQELDRKTGEDIRDILREYAAEGCLAHRDTLHIIDHDEED